MDVEKIFHMKGGNDETSYTRNSSLQKRASDKVKHITLQTIEEVYLTIMPNSLGIADLGCSSGFNSLSNIRDMVYSIEEISSSVMSKQAPQFHIYLNDLPTNDFNAIFQALPDFCRELKRGRTDGGPCVYIAAYPGSFYGRLFPDNCLHFIYSSHCLHWLSKVPPGVYNGEGMSINKGSVYISSRSPAEVVEAYQNQFRRDFTLFLRSRSAELVGDGRMVLILLGREGPNHVDRGNSLLWELLTRSLATLVHQGDVEEEKLDSYDAHFYAPSSVELEDVVKSEGSFKLERLEMFEIEKDVTSSDGLSYGTMVAMAVRAIQESSIAHHFGEAIMDRLFEQYGKFVDEEMGKEDIRPITFILVLRKL